MPATTTLEATGTGSVLTLANLTSVTEATNNYPAQIQFEALAGGTVTLSALDDDQYRHGGPGKRRHRQRLERAGADRGSCESAAGPTRHCKPPTAALLSIRAFPNSAA